MRYSVFRGAALEILVMGSISGTIFHEILCIYPETAPY